MPKTNEAPEGGLSQDVTECAAVQEPLNFLIARKAEELLALLDQVLPEDDATQKAGGVLSLVKWGLPGVIRNMNDGTYNQGGLVPAVYNPAYLPPPGLETLLDSIQKNELQTSAETRDAFQYNEGVRWTIARVRQAFRSHREGYPVNAEGTRIGHISSTAPAKSNTPKSERTVEIPVGYRAVLVPAGTTPETPDYAECARQADLATGLPSLRQNPWLNIFIREINRWCHQRAAQPEEKKVARSSARKTKGN